MKRFLVVLAAAGALAAAVAAPAFADAVQNDHNCEGSANSGATPVFVYDGKQGLATSGRAQDGDQAGFVQDYNAKCVNRPSGP